MGSLIFGVIIGIFYVLCTIALIHIFRDKNHDHLQMQIQAQDCDITNLRLQQEALETQLQGIEKREVVTIHYPETMTSEEVAEQIAQGIRRARAVKDIT